MAGGFLFWLSQVDPLTNQFATACWNFHAFQITMHRIQFVFMPTEITIKYLSI